MELVLKPCSICSIAAPLLFLFGEGFSEAQIPPQDPPEEEQEAAPEQERKPEAPGPPEGILPVGEITRVGFAPSDLPQVLLHGSRLVIATVSGSVVAHDAGTGEFRWKLGLPGERLFAPGVSRIDPLEILLASASGRLFVIDGETGEIHREIQLPFELALAPLVDGPTLYLGTPGGDVIAFDLETGSERFRSSTAEAPLALAASGGTIVVSGSERTLVAIHAGSGAERWRFRGRSAFRAPAVFAEDRLYVGNDAGEFYCLALQDGDTRFHWSTGASIPFAALVEEKLVYVTSFGNELYAYATGGGTERYRVSLPGRPASGPWRFGRRLLVATYDGALVEIDPQKGAVSETYEAPGELASAPTFLSVLPSRGSRNPDGDEAPPASPGAPWYLGHRVALPLRTGEVLLLGHRPEERKEEKPEPPPKPPGETPGEDSLSRK